MKGAELPINTLIIIVLAVVVLIALIVLLSGGIKIPQQSVSQEVALRNACMKLLNQGCPDTIQTIWTPDFDSDKDGRVGACSNTVKVCGLPAANGDADNLYMLCECWFQLDSHAPNFRRDCKKLCNCPNL